MLRIHQKNWNGAPSTFFLSVRDSNGFRNKEFFGEASERRSTEAIYLQLISLPFSSVLLTKARLAIDEMNP